ncbi:hypothetical protein V1264_000134 [Littorina saxatilis]|uniref:Reverse transcriptase domain-containing protein n=1 Tax=Littorina saxatilis TaxID=31220 RepID=A0AAN9BWJ3_9CAEN
MTLGDRIDSNGARPVRIHQAGAAPGSAPQRSPPSATGGPFISSCGARGRERKATGRKNSRAKDNPTINIMHWNAEGVSNKKEELEHFLYENSINICCIQETHLQEGKPFKIRGYQVFRSDRQGRKKGGVMTLVRNNINASETNRYMEEAEYIEVKITTNDSKMNIVNYYCPNDKMLSLDTIQVPDSGFLIAGDFNSQSQSWGYKTLDRRGEDIESWQDDNHLILVNGPTDPSTFYSRRWHSTTTPDLALCTDDIHKTISRKVDEQLGGSDHRPVLLTISRDSASEHPQHPRWNYKKAKWGLFNIRTNELTRAIETEGRNINNVIKEFNASIIQAAKDSIPRGVRKDYIPYWSDELQKTHDALTRMREEAETNPSQENNIKLQESKAKHLKTKLECKRRGWREKTAGLNMEKDTTKLWKLTRALNEEGNKGQKITLEEEGRTLTGKAAANAFAQAYRGESDTTIPLPLQKEVRTEIRERTERNVQDAMQQDITMAELKNAIKKLKKKKSPGPDNITNEMLQHIGNSALQKLLGIFNLSWRQGQVPQCWKEARMIPVLKKGKNKTKTLSYRPISLTSCVCKTMERIVNQRLQLYLESESIIVPEQAGFRQHRSTEDQTTHLSQVIEDAYQAQKVTLATFIDLQKAFDKVWKDGLLVKLLRSGVKGNMYEWTKSYLHNRKARVLVDGHCGRKVLLHQGVPQGGVLSPTLFILFINDLVPELPKGVQAALYADDLVLWCSEEYATTATYRMQLALEKVAAWAEDWCVTINREKTTATLFTLSAKATPGKLTLGDTPLKFEDQQTYLGVTYDKRMTWKQHIMNAEGKARRKLNIMRKLAGSHWGANEKILKTVYQGTVRPHLEYGSSSWATAAKTHQQALDKVQNQALRIITGAMKSTPIQKMEQVTGIPPLSKRRDCKTMVQATKYQCTHDHPMSDRLKKMSLGRLKRSSFALEARALQKKHQTEMPELVEPPSFSLDAPPWEDRQGNLDIQTSVPYLTTKDEQSNATKKALTLAMLEERYPQEAWIRVYTDGSATEAVKNGGAGVYVQYPSGERQAEAIPTGLHCTNYRAEVQALIHAAYTINDRVNHDNQVVFLTDALSVLQQSLQCTAPGVSGHLTCTDTFARHGVFSFYICPPLNGHLQNVDTDTHFRSQQQVIPPMYGQTIVKFSPQQNR